MIGFFPSPCSYCATQVWPLTPADIAGSVLRTLAFSWVSAHLSIAVRLVASIASAATGLANSSTIVSTPISAGAPEFGIT